jgi:hypothetical protein
MRFCPHCGSDLSPYLAAGAVKPQVVSRQQEPYDQTRTWKRLMKLASERRDATPDPRHLVEETMSALPSEAPYNAIVHLVFDRNVVPQGGALYSLALSDGQQPMRPEHLRALGYVVEDDKVWSVDDCPVGQAYQVLDYWGGLKQHRRWHLLEPATLSPARNGDPFFMDENMVAFGARWSDLQMYREALDRLLELFAHGVKDTGCVAMPMVLEVYWRSDPSAA